MATFVENISTFRASVQDVVVDSAFLNRVDKVAEVCKAFAAVLGFTLQNVEQARKLSDADCLEYTQKIQTFKAALRLSEQEAKKDGASDNGEDDSELLKSFFVLPWWRMWTMATAPAARFPRATGLETQAGPNAVTWLRLS